MLLLMAAALCMIGGGLVAAAVFLLLWLYTGPKVHAPPHSPPQSDVDAESEFGRPCRIPWLYARCHRSTMSDGKHLVW